MHNNIECMIQLTIDNTRVKTLPNLIRPILKIVFVGTNPGTKSAKIGHYFAGKSNMFWKLLFESKITPEQLTTETDNKLLNYEYGLTDVIKRPTRSTSELRSIDGVGARKRLDKLIEKYAPKIVAFVGKTGFRYYLNEKDHTLYYGVQKFTIGQSIVYLLPSTSGQSFADTTYVEKLFWYKKLFRYSNSK